MYAHSQMHMHCANAYKSSLVWEVVWLCQQYNWFHSKQLSGFSTVKSYSNTHNSGLSPNKEILPTHLSHIIDLWWVNG